MKKISRIVSLIVLASITGQAVAQEPTVTGGLRQMGRGVSAAAKRRWQGSAAQRAAQSVSQRAGQMTQSARQRAQQLYQEKFAFADPQIKAAQKQLDELKTVATCMETNTCTPEQAKKIKIALRVIQAAIVAVVVAGISYAAYRGAKAAYPMILARISGISQQIENMPESDLKNMIVGMMNIDILAKGKAIDIAENMVAKMKSIPNAARQKAVDLLGKEAQVLMALFLKVSTIRKELGKKYGLTVSPTVPQATLSQLFDFVEPHIRDSVSSGVFEAGLVPSYPAPEAPITQTPLE